MKSKSRKAQLSKKAAKSNNDFQASNRKDSERAKLKKLLFEPIAPYYADALNTLFSVVQGLAMGIYGYEISECLFKTDSIIKGDAICFSAFEFFIAFLVICVLWHRYISHNQLYAWILRARDTVIPVVFGLLEVFLILTIQTPHNLQRFALYFALISTWGFVGYLNVHFRFDSSEAQIIYSEHFAEYGLDFTKDLYYAVKEFEDKALRELRLTLVLMWECVAIIHWNLYSEKIQMAIFGTLSSLILLRLLIDNIWKHLLKSPKLNAYPFWTEITKTQRWKK
jgi:hypothetical protein